MGRVRIAVTLKSLGHTGTVEEFRATLAEVKVAHFADWSTEELCRTRDEAAEFFQSVMKRLNAARLTRPFILRSLVVLRKNQVKVRRTHRTA